MKPLTDRQKRFIDEYCIDQQATAAARRAGYSPKYAEQFAMKMLRIPAIEQIVTARLNAIAQKADVSAERILKALMRIAECDLRTAYAPDGTLRPIHELPEDVALCISSIDSDEILNKQTGQHIGWTRKVKFWDKTKALELLGKYRRLFIERVEGSGPNGEVLHKLDLSLLDVDVLKKLAEEL